MLLPVVEVLFDERPGSVWVIVVPVDGSARELGRPVPDLLAQGEDGIVEVGEVLVEGWGRESHLRRHVGESQSPHTVGLDRGPDGLEDPLSGADAACTQDLSIDRRRLGAHGRTLAKFPHEPWGPLTAYLK